MSRKPPRWTVAFLRALERCGDVRAAAVDAGVDHSTAYYRRRTYADFAAAWDAAVGAHKARVEGEVQERVGFWDKLRKGGLSVVSSAVLGCPPDTLRAADPSTIRSSADGPPPRARLREELNATSALGGQLKRVGAGRWDAAAERRFFDELAGSANVRRAAAAAGVSSNAVYARRMKRPDFRAKWDAVLETGRAAIEMHLVEAAKKSFDPDDLDLGEAAEPRVSVAEAIRIVQLHGNKTQKQSIEQIEPPEEEIEAARQRLFDKLQKLREREMPRWLAEGWSHDESYDQMVPPGWVKSADYRPRVVEPEGPDFWEQVKAGG